MQSCKTAFQSPRASAGRQLRTRATNWFGINGSDDPEVWTAVLHAAQRAEPLLRMELIDTTAGFNLQPHNKSQRLQFPEKGDLLLLGARTLEGLSLTVDSCRKKWVAPGPLPVA